MLRSHSTEFRRSGGLGAHEEVSVKEYPFIQSLTLDLLPWLICLGDYFLTTSALLLSMNLLSREKFGWLMVYIFL